MLLQFKVKNFKSFLDEACLDMRATKIKEHEYALLDINNSGDKLLPVAAIYGANAAGKSNLVFALNIMSYIVLRSIDIDSSIEDEKKAEGLPYFPFLFSKEGFNQPTEFQINFVTDHKEYLYEIRYEREKVIFESLKAREYIKIKGNFLNVYTKEFKKNTKIGQNKITKLLEINKKDIDNISTTFIKDTDLLLTALGRREIEPFKEIYNWFKHIKYFVPRKPMKEYTCREGSEIKKLYDDEVEKTKYLEFIQKANPSVYNIGLKPKDDDKKLYSAFFKIKMIESDDTIELPLVLESEGTLRIFDMYPGVHNILTNGGILLIDEMSAGLHPYLLQYLISLFRSEKTNPHRAQLIFNLHNPVVLSRRYLRRDEIWFVEKDEMGRSELYSLVDFKDEDGLKIRNDADYGKWYLLGCFGAVPDTSNWGGQREQ